METTKRPILDELLGDSYDRRFRRIDWSSEEGDGILGLDRLMGDVEAIDRESKDFVIPARELKVVHDDRNVFLEHDDMGRLPFSRWSLSQFTGLIGPHLTSSYIQRCLENGAVELAHKNLNHWFQEVEGSRELLIRTHGERIRGILSPRFSRLDNAFLLEAVQEALPGTEFALDRYSVNPEDMTARIVNARGLDVPGEDLFGAIQIKNSEVGKSAVVIEVFVYKLVCRNGLIAKQNQGVLYRRKHIGLTQNEFYQAILHVVEQAPAFFADYTRKIIAAKNIPLNNALYLELLEDFKANIETTEELIARHRDSMDGFTKTAWGFINAITEIAQDFPEDRQIELETYAGDLLERVAV